MRYLHSSACLAVIVVAGFMVTSQHVHAQSQLTGSAELWIPILPDYRAGSIVPEGGGNPLQENIFSSAQDGVGIKWGMHGFYHFRGYRTMFESELSYASVDDIRSSATFADPNPLPAAQPPSGLLSNRWSRTGRAAPRRR